MELFYQVQERKSLKVIKSYLTLKVAEGMLKKFEKIDKAEDEYTPDFYEIKEMDIEEN